jgi:hypothetical protein
MDDDIERTWANIKRCLAEAMEKEADGIAHEDQLTRDHNQPPGRIVSEGKQENLNSIGASKREGVKHLRDTAA